MSLTALAVRDFWQALIARSQGTAPLILEFGSGRSTSIWCERDAAVVSVEHDPAWIFRDPRAEYVFAPLGIGARYDAAALDFAVDRVTHLARTVFPRPGAVGIVADGPPAKLGADRGALRPWIERLIERGLAEVILVDDTHRPAERGLADRLAEGHCTGWGRSRQSGQGKSWDIFSDPLPGSIPE